MTVGRKPDLNRELRNVVVRHPSAKGVEIKQPEVSPTAEHKAEAVALMPDWLDADEQSFWLGTAAQMVMLGRLKPHFVHAYAEYVSVVIRLQRAKKLLAESGWTYSSKTRNGLQYKSRPEVAQLNDDWRKWRSLVGEFGLAPAAERGIKTTPQGDMFAENW